jgi:tetratricopeptide (TPR) repeat protein
VRRVLTITGVLAGFGLAVFASVAVVRTIDGQRQYRQFLTTGEQALADGDMYAAIEAFSGALALRPDSMVAYYRRGEAYRAQNRTDEALANFREANRRAPDAAEPLIALGDLFDAQDEPAQAAVWYGLAAERLGDANPMLLYRLALARYKSGELTAALAPLERLVAKHDAFGEAHYLLGLARRDTGQPPEAAIAALEHAVKVAPGLLAAREELADLYRITGQRVQELRQLQALADADSQPSRRLAIAVAQADADQYDGALGTMSEILVRTPADSRAQITLARVLLARAEGRPDRAAVTRALAVLERALGGTARRSEGMALFGRALYLSGDAVTAERILREAVATSPVELDAFRYLADAAARLGHDIVARDALLNLDLLEGDTAPAIVRASRARRIGEWSLRADEPDRAAMYLASAVELGASDPQTLGLLARARWSLGELDAARDALKQALALAPRDPELQRLARTMR